MHDWEARLSLFLNVWLLQKPDVKELSYTPAKPDTDTGFEETRQLTIYHNILPQRHTDCCHTDGTTE